LIDKPLRTYEGLKVSRSRLGNI